MTTQAELEFHKDGPFFQMVSAATISFCAYPLVCSEKEVWAIKPHDYITLTGVVVPDHHFHPYKIRTEAVSGRISMEIYFGTVCMMLVNTAYECVKRMNDHSPLFEFFRHIRNASSHLNHFRFSAKEPQRPASWRSLSIDHNLKGDSNPLQNAGCFGNILATADVFALLWDVEQLIAPNFTNHTKTRIDVS